MTMRVPEIRRVATRVMRLSSRARAATDEHQTWPHGAPDRLRWLKFVFPYACLIHCLVTLAFAE